MQHMQNTQKAYPVPQAPQAAARPSGQQPEKKFNTGAVTATVWKNSTMTKDGKSAEYHTISLQRRYLDDKGTWQTASSLRVNDLPKAALVLQKAYEYLVLRGQDTPLSGVSHAQSPLHDSMIEVEGIM